MLTYSVSLNGLFTISPLQKIAAAQFVHTFWDVNCDWEVLRYTAEDSCTAEIVDHHEEILCIMNNFTEEHKFSSSIKVILKESLYLLYQAYCQMLQWRRTYDPCMQIDVFEEGELYAPNYLNVEGEFNDFVWAKRFVLNLRRRIDHRFYLACLYWFENETAVLWPVLKRSKFAPFLENYLGDMPSPLPLITLRVFQLENQMEKLSEIHGYVGDFWQTGFIRAIKSGYDYAAYYFWQKISESEKKSIMMNDAFFELICPYIDFPDKLCCILHSQLSKDRKKKFLDWCIANKRLIKWLSLLTSPYSQSVCPEMMGFIYKLPIKTYCNILEMLTEKKNYFKTPFYDEIFCMLWKNLTPEGKQFTLNNRGKFIIKNFIFNKSFCNLGYILKHLSNEEKDECLFNRLYGAVIFGLYVLVLVDKFDLLQEYLLFFLIEIDPVTQNEILRENANLLLRRFIQEPYFLVWCTEELTKEQHEVVNEKIAVLQSILTLSDKLPEEVGKQQNEDATFSSAILKRKCEVKLTTFKKKLFLTVKQP